MKKLVLVVTIAIIAQVASAQVKEGTIVYEQKIDLYRRLPADNEQMKAMIPHFRTSKFELSFADGQSYYKMQEVEPDVTETTSGGNNIVMKFGGASTESYRNFNTHMQVEKRQLAEKDYIIEDSLHVIQWKLSDETKTILGYNCKKATGKTERGSELEAWYTEEIPISSGPESFIGLPGMVLLVDINKGEFVYTATQIKKTVDKKELKAPTKGKKITNAEFVKLQKEIMGNNPGGMRIIRN